jgi:hypothetical protein
MQWKLQEVKESGARKIYQGKLQAMSAASSRERPCGVQMVSHWGQGCPSTWSSDHDTTYAHARHGSTGVNVCPAGFQPCFGLILPCHSSVPPFWNADSNLCHCILEVYNFLFWFYRGLQLRVCFDYQRTLWTWAFNSVGTMKTMGTLGDGLNGFCILRWAWASWGPRVECYGLRRPGGCCNAKRWACDG